MELIKSSSYILRVTVSFVCEDLFCAGHLQWRYKVHNCAENLRGYRDRMALLALDPLGEGPSVGTFGRDSCTRENLGKSIGSPQSLGGRISLFKLAYLRNLSSKK